MGIGAAIGGIVSGIGSVASGIIGGNAAQSAAQQQAGSAQNAAAAQLAMFQQVQGNLNPFISAGQQAIGAYQGAIPSLTAPFQPTMAQLAATPGYQFTLGQGLQATQNSYAAQGLGSSGAALKGAANYAEGLAGTTYQQQFQNYLGQNQQIANLLFQPVALGESAAAGAGTLGVQSQGIANQFSTSGAAAQAAGTVGAANAATNAIGGVGSSASNTALLLALQNGGMFGGGGGGSSAGTLAGNLGGAFA